jgi:hypothetical protein
MKPNNKNLPSVYSGDYPKVPFEEINKEFDILSKYFTLRTRLKNGEIINGGSDPAFLELYGIMAQICPSKGWSQSEFHTELHNKTNQML